MLLTSGFYLLLPSYCSSPIVHLLCLLSNAAFIPTSYCFLSAPTHVWLSKLPVPTFPASVFFPVLLAICPCPCVTIWASWSYTPRVCVPIWASWTFTLCVNVLPVLIAAICSCLCVAIWASWTYTPCVYVLPVLIAAISSCPCVTISAVHPQNVRFQNVRFQNVCFQNVRFQNVRFTKRQVYKTSGFKTSGFKMSSF
jgi:hypothetical protein